MKVEIFYFEGCPNHKPAVERLQSVMRQQGITAELAEIEVPDAAAAKALGFLGSPTIRVDGLDIDPVSRTATGSGFACRRYANGLPPEEMIVAALREAQGAGSPGTRSSSRRTAFAGLAAIGSVLAASTCCLPVLPLVFAASLAGSSTVLTVLRPYLLGASVLFITYGFYQARQSKRCSRKPGILSSALLWLSAFFVFVSIFFPQVLASAAANLFAR